MMVDSFNNDGRGNNNTTSDNRSKMMNCRQCGETFSHSEQFCKYDGCPLTSEPVDVVPTRQQTEQLAEQPAESSESDEGGEKHSRTSPRFREFDKTMEAEGNTLALQRTATDGLEKFHSSVCPVCGAWKNWEIRGARYKCKSCEQNYLYENDELFRVVGRLDSGGRFVPDENVAAQSDEFISPFYKLLTDVDGGNRAHWIKKFQGFQADKFNTLWNWPSFFFGPLRYLHKGIWKRAILYYLAFQIAAGIVEFIPEMGPMLSTVMGIGGSIFFGIMGSDDYYRFCTRYHDDVAGARKEKKFGIFVFFLLIVGSLMIRYFFTRIGGH